MEPEELECILQRKIETEGEPDADITEKDRHKDRETKSKR